MILIISFTMGFYGFHSVKAGFLALYILVHNL